MKKIFWLTFVFLAFILITIQLYNKTYYITDENICLSNELLKTINKPKIIGTVLDIKQSINIDNKKYILYTIDKFIGEAELKKGINNKYKLEYTSFSEDMLQYRVQTTRNGNYFVMDGKNQGKLISSLKITIDKRDYTIKVPEQDFFIVYCPVSENVQNKFPTSDNLKLLDKSDKDITIDVIKKYEDSKPKETTQ